jgi:hypothetical protein
MKPRARRVTIAAAVLGAGVVGVLVYPTVRDHVEAWRLQLTRETVTIEPGLVWKDHPLVWRRSCESLVTELKRDGKWVSCSPTAALFCILVDYSGQPVIFDPVAARSAFFGMKGSSSLSTAHVLQIVRDNGWRVLEQRFPRKAYVVIRDPALMKPGIHLAPKN